MLRPSGTFRTRPAFILALLVAAFLGCEKPHHVVYLEDEVPLVAPLEGMTGAPGEGWDDPPTRVARVSELSGPVSVQQAGLDDWSAASRNLPLKGGDALWAGPNARAEVQIGSTGLRTREGTSLSILRVNDRFFQVGLDQGSMVVHILPGEFPDNAEVDTPAGAVNLTQAGTYRVDMDPALPEGSVTVRSGQASISLEGEVIPVGPGERILLAGGAEPTYQVEKALEPDAFEAWGDGRDRSAALSKSALKLGKDVMGAADLDGHGTWQTHPQYGEMWVPKVDPGWAPYRNGRWTWVDPWGWTWVDEAPWGFAPSHYGRWVNQSGTWGWLPRDPGATAVRPVYAPALVAFVASAPGQAQMKMPGGGVAWFPLGPREPFTPAYPASRAYVRNLNAWAGPSGVGPSGARPGPANSNLLVPGAVTAVPRTVFTSCSPVGPAVVPIQAGSPLFRHPISGGAPALAPTSFSFQTSAALSRPPVTARSRPLVARSPLPAAPLPFTSRMAALQAAHGRPQPAAVSTGRGPAGGLSGGPHGQRPTRPWINAVSPREGGLRRRVYEPPPPPPRTGTAMIRREDAPPAPRTQTQGLRTQTQGLRPQTQGLRPQTQGLRSQTQGLRSQTQGRNPAGAARNPLAMPRRAEAARSAPRAQEPRQQAGGAPKAGGKAKGSGPKKK